MEPSATIPSDSLDFAIRPAKPEDFDTIRTIHGITFQEHQEREPSFDSEGPFIDPSLENLAKTPTRWSRWLASRQTKCLVAGRQDEVLGYIVYLREKFFGSNSVMVIDISIDPDWRKHGLGRALLLAMEDTERDTGITGYYATVWPKNAASLALFDATGYTTAVLPRHEAGTENYNILHKNVRPGSKTSPRSTPLFTGLSGRFTVAIIALFVVTAGLITGFSH